MNDAAREESKRFDQEWQETVEREDANNLPRDLMTWVCQQELMASVIRRLMADRDSIPGSSALVAISSRKWQENPEAVLVAMGEYERWIAKAGQTAQPVNCAELMLCFYERIEQLWARARIEV